MPIEPTSLAGGVCPPGLSLWLVDLDGPGDAGGAVDPSRLLDPGEQARAERFHFVRDARRFTASHVALRRLLAGHIGGDPAALRFEAGTQGKPRLAQADGAHFNLSHSGGWALVGLCPYTEIGVDIEVPRDMSDLVGLAGANFTPGEQAALQAEPDTLRLQAFLRCWTRKEACIKAIGSGLSVEPACFEAGIEAAARTTVVPFEGRSHRVTVASLPLPVEALAAVAWVEPGDQRPIAR